MKRIDEVYKPYDAYVTKEHLLAKKKLTQELCLPTTPPNSKEWKLKQLLKRSLPRLLSWHL